MTTPPYGKILYPTFWNTSYFPYSDKIQDQAGRVHYVWTTTCIFTTPPPPYGSGGFSAFQQPVSEDLDNQRRYASSTVSGEAPPSIQSRVSRKGPICRNTHGLYPNSQKPNRDEVPHEVSEASKNQRIRQNAMARLTFGYLHLRLFASGKADEYSLFKEPSIHTGPVREYKRNLLSWKKALHRLDNPHEAKQILANYEPFEESFRQELSQKKTVESDSEEKNHGQLPKNQNGSINWDLIQFPEGVSLEKIRAAKEEISHAAYLLTVKKES